MPAATPNDLRFNSTSTTMILNLLHHSPTHTQRLASDLLLAKVPNPGKNETVKRHTPRKHTDSKHPDPLRVHGKILEQVQSPAL